MMRMVFAWAALLILASGASAEPHARSSAILFSPIHEGQVVRGGGIQNFPDSRP
jgi:hypothetical protein